MRAETGRGVDRIPQRRVLESTSGAHHADHGWTGVDPDAPADRWQSLREQLLLQLGRAVDEVVGAADRQQRVVVLQPRGVPESHDLVPDVLVDGAVPGKDDAAKVVQVHLDELGHIAGSHRLRHRGEAADVDEHQRDVATLAAAEDVIHAASGLGELRNNLGLQVLAEQSCDLALLAVLIEEPVCSHAGICEGDPKPWVEEVWHPVAEGRER